MCLCVRECVCVCVCVCERSCVWTCMHACVYACMRIRACIKGVHVCLDMLNLVSKWSEDIAEYTTYIPFSS